MPRPFLGEEAERARRVAVLRTAGIVLAVALGAVAVWLIVTSTSQKRIEIGILAGLWGLLIGAYCAFGSRPAPAPAAPVATMPAFDPAAIAPGGGVLDVRPRNEVQRKAEIAARREFQARLEKVLRREVQEGLSRELAGLRAEVAALRSELVEKVGGQLRLERIETTRLIGSDLEALQQQVRELKFLQTSDEDGTETVTTVHRSIGAPARARVVEPIAEAEIVEDEPAPAPEPVAEVVPEPEPEPEPVAEVVPEPEPEPVAEAVPEPEPEPAPVPVAEAVPVPVPVPVPEPKPAPVDVDPFAAMPRLSPFTDFEPLPEAVPAPAAESDTAAAGRHGAGGARRAGGRRYREDDSDDNVLARILQREGTGSQ